MYTKAVILAAGVIIPAALAWGTSGDEAASKAADSCSTAESVKEQEKGPVDPVDAVLEKLNAKTKGLKSYECRVEYRFRQPLLESEALRKGSLRFAKFGKKSKLRMNFETLKQDDEDEQPYIEQFIFDGTWLTQLDFQIKAAKRYELAEPNKPTDAFDLASKNLPIVGFSKVEDLKKQFEVSLVEKSENKSAKLIQLHLKVRPDSIHKDSYTAVDFWIDEVRWLPARIVAYSTEEDIYEIKLLKAKVNSPISESVFDFEIPAGFGEPEIVPLKKKRSG